MPTENEGQADVHTQNTQNIQALRDEAMADVMGDDSLFEPEQRGEVEPEKADEEPVQDTDEKGDTPLSPPEKKAKGGTDVEVEDDEEETEEDEKEERKSLSELRELAAEKQRERRSEDARRQRDTDQRNYDDDRRDLERERKAHDRRAAALRADPVTYMQRELGLDPSQAAERIVAKTLRPAEEKLREENITLKARLDSLEGRYDTDQKTRAQQAQDSHRASQARQVYDSWDQLTSDAEAYPETASLDLDERIWYGDRAASLLTRAYPDRQFSQEQIAQQVEYGLALRRAVEQPEGDGGKAEKKKKTGGSPKGGGKKSPPDTLTNDLASESAGSTRNLLDPDVRRANAIREAGRLGLK